MTTAMVYFLLLLLFQEIWGQDVLSVYHGDRLRLHDKLFKDYRREIPSIYLGRSGHPAIPINCTLTLVYANLLSINEPQQTAKMIIDIVYDWTDSRLTWNPSEFGGIENIIVMIKGLVWTPDVLPYDIYSYTDTLPEEQRAVTITHTGVVKMYQSAVVDFVCHMNLVDFPFDTQSCTLKLCSFVALSTEIDVDAAISPDIDMSGMGNGEWSYVNMSSGRQLSEWGPDQEYWIVNFNFKFSRTTTYYISIIIIPSFILTFLSVSGLFWGAIIGASSMETLNLGFAAILAMMFVLQMATQDMPRINQIDKLSKYSMVNLGLITLASVGVVVIGKLECLCRKKTPGPRRELHAVLLVVFICVTIANFCFLVTKTELELVQ